MPYITRSRRDTAGVPPELPGDLHYAISQLIDGYLYHQPNPYDDPYNGPHYQQFNDVMGVLACAQAEIYRRIIAPYEDVKIRENGDVYSGVSKDSDGGTCPGCMDGTCRCSQV